MTLLEVAISTVLTGLVFLGAMNSITINLRTWSDAKSERESRGLAEQLLAEITAASYLDVDQTPLFGREAGESAFNRNSWDDVDDYNGWSASPPERKDGTAISEYSGYTRSVTVTRVKLTDPTQTSLTDEGVVRIVVQVTNPAGRTTELTAFRSNAGALAQSFPADFTTTTRVEIQIKSGSNTTTEIAIPARNFAEDE